MIADSRKAVVQMWGRDFDMVPTGLSREQVVAFVTRLIEENRELSEKVKNLGFLQQLAQMTVAEADEMAAGVRRKAQEEAAATIEAGCQEAARIKDKAIEDSCELVAESRRRLEAEMRKQANLACTRIIDQFNGIVDEFWPAGGDDDGVKPEACEPADLPG